MSSRQAVGQPLSDSPMPPLQQPDEAEEDQADHHRQADGSEQIGGRVQLEILDAHAVEPMQDTFGRLIQGQLVEFIKVPFQQHQNALAIDQKLPALLAVSTAFRHGHRRHEVAWLHPLNSLMGQPYPGRPIQVAIFSRQHDDGFMKQDQGLCQLLLIGLHSGFGGPAEAGPQQADQQQAKPPSFATAPFVHQVHLSPCPGIHCCLILSNQINFVC